MLRKPGFAVAAVSIILLVYCVLINFNISLPLVYFIFCISPFLLIWMAYSVIRHGNYKGKELNEDEEWGYQDRNRDELDVL
ncbi:MAG: hypothetical protein ACHQF0_11060 [Chitinophagales bacterium]